eukprot:gb/GFBE01070964.1/.p1 GENE.gb/GFBE01070964.1/~~gb/GFBE01070964.1/.p1  ORF type:complete len:549 (+),score=90.03 gb/GFBE01070964.1/:1-1647(+)
MANVRVEVSPSSSRPAEEEDSECGPEVCVLPTLSTDIDDDVLRGAPISTVMSSHARVFNTSSGSHEDYDKSVSTQRLDDFVSHDWASSRVEKFMSLCMVHNGQAASIASILAAIITHLLQSKLCFGILPYSRPYDPNIVDFTDYGLHYGIWAQLSCPVVFTFVYFYWQQLKGIVVRRSRLVFLDKLCIHQVDHHMKMKGIRQLAGFLNKSDRFVVFWSKRYFTRLWCLFELAGWLHQGRSMDSVVFVPLSYAVIVFMTVVFLSLMALVVTFGFALNNTVSMVLFAILFFAITPPFVPLLRNIIYHLRMLPKQIEDFTITDSHCHCCAVNHLDPHTGEQIPCDRALIYRTLTKWFPPSDSEAQAADVRLPPGEMADIDPRCLKTFDDTVRQLFEKFVLVRVGPTRVSYHHAVMGSLPYVWRAFDVAVAFGTFPDSTVVLLAFLRHFVISWATIPAVYKLIIQVATIQDRLIGKPQACWKNTLANISLSSMAVCIMMIVFAPVEVSDMYGMPPQVHLAVWLFQILLAVLVYNPFSCSRRQKPTQIVPMTD